MYLMGYDADNTTVPQNGFAIHHPSGNVARVSSYNATACGPPTLAADLQCVMLTALPASHAWPRTVMWSCTKCAMRLKCST